MALGARRRAVMGLVMRETLSLVLTGIALGIVAVIVLNRSFATLSRELAQLLFQLAPNDTFTFAIAIGIMIAVATFAGYLPARRAARVDPNVALRYE